jgi:DNA repair protein RadC
MSLTNTTSLYRLQLIREADYPYDLSQLSRSSDAAKFFRPLFAGIDREQMAVAFLDAKHRVIGIGVVSIGSLTASIVHPRLCFAKHNRGYVAAAVMWRSARSSSARAAPEWSYAT